MKNIAMILAAVLFVAALKMYMDHRNPAYVGEYKPQGGYANVSSLKHDIFKIGFISLFPLLIYGIQDGENLFDMSNLKHSVLVRTGVTLGGFFIFYELLQPYVNKLNLL